MPKQVIKLSSTKKDQLVNITKQVQDAIDFDDGILTIFCPHTTAGLTINESADPDVARDVLMKLEKIVSEDSDFRHAEGNSVAHIKASLIGSSLQVLVEKGSLRLGTWQGIFLAEFDGPRTRNVWLMYNIQ